MIDFNENEYEKHEWRIIESVLALHACPVSHREYYAQQAIRHLFELADYMEVNKEKMQKILIDVDSCQYCTNVPDYFRNKLNNVFMKNDNADNDFADMVAVMKAYV